MPGRQDDAGTV